MKTIFDLCSDKTLQSLPHIKTTDAYTSLPADELRRKIGKSPREDRNQIIREIAKLYRPLLNAIAAGNADDIVTHREKFSRGVSWATSATNGAIVLNKEIQAKIKSSLY